MITRQSTARTIIVGPVLDSTGAAKTDEVVGSIKITKNGVVGSANGSATLDHDHAGKYRLALTASDTDTVGVLEISLNSGTNDMPVKGLNVVETAIWDALFADGSTGLLPANVTQFGGSNLTAASGIPEVKVASMAANTLTAAAIAPDAGAELAALVETYIVNEGDATAVLQAVADKIAADWVAGDASPIAIATAVWSTATRTITGGSLTTSPPTAAVIADAVWDEARSGHVTAGTFGEKVAAELDSATLTKIDNISTDTGTTLPAAIAAIEGGGGSGTGARTVTITINDGTTALQNAIVRMTEGANTFTALTNVSGVAVFNLDDATYTVGVTKSGYSYSGTTLVVNGTETATYSMTLVSVTPPANPDLSAVIVLCLGVDFEFESGVTVDIRIKTLPSGSTNTAYPGMKQTATSNGSGIATLEAPKGSVCEWKRGKEDSWTEITIGSDDQTNVTSIIGSRY